MREKGKQMKTSWTQTLLVMAIFMGGGIASAQNYYAPQVTPQPTPGYGWGGFGGFGYHSSTEAEGVLRGAGAFAEGVGRGNYFNSLAEINLQEAEARARENRLKGIQAYFEAKRINAEAKQLAQRPRPTADQLKAVAKAGLPDRLTPAQYQPRLGQLHWPAALEGERFTRHREALDILFAGRTTSDSGVSSPFYRDVKRLTDQMQGELKQEMGNLSQMEYMAAYKFLNSVAYEAQAAHALQELVASR